MAANLQIQQLKTSITVFQISSHSVHKFNNIETKAKADTEPKLNKGS